MTITEINNLTVENTLTLLLYRLVDFSLLGEDQDHYTVEGEGHDGLILHPSLTKPSISEFTNELGLYKTELLVIENARLAEVARVLDINTRWESLDDVRGIISKAGLDIGNPAIELKRIIEEDDQTRLELLESSMVDLLAERNVLDVKAAKRAVSRGLIAICHECIAIVMDHNIDNALTKEQKDQQALDYIDVFDVLKAWRPGKLKTAITNMTPDGVLVKQELKDELLEYLTAAGL